MRKFISSFIIVAIAVVLLIPVVQKVSRRGLTKIAIQVAPNDSSIAVNGNITKGRDIYVSPGNYKIEASKSGFTKDLVNLQVSAGDKEKSALLVLGPDSAEAEQWIKQNPKVQKDREAIGSAKVLNGQAALTSKYPMVNVLPQNFHYFSISYNKSSVHPDDPTEIGITIEATTPYYRQLALKWIKDHGYDPSDYEIIFLAASNPLAGDH